MPDYLILEHEASQATPLEKSNGSKPGRQVFFPSKPLILQRWCQLPASRGNAKGSDVPVLGPEHAQTTIDGSKAQRAGGTI